MTNHHTTSRSKMESICEGLICQQISDSVEASAIVLLIMTNTGGAVVLVLNIIVITITLCRQIIQA